MNHFKRYFLVTDAAMMAALQSRMLPSGHHEVRLSTGPHILMTFDQAWGRGAHNLLPQGWLELPHLMLGQPLPAAAAQALAAAEIGVVGTDLMPQVIQKLHAWDSSGAWIP